MQTIVTSQLYLVLAAFQTRLGVCSKHRLTWCCTAVEAGGSVYSERAASQRNHDMNNIKTTLGSGDITSVYLLTVTCRRLGSAGSIYVI